MEPIYVRLAHLFVAIDKTPVKMRGDALSECIWQGKQWAVTEYGIECRDGCYVIEAKRLSETRLIEETELPEWPLQLAEKNWVDINDFCTAFMVALSVFPSEHDFNGVQVIESVSLALKEHGRVMAFEQKLEKVLEEKFNKTGTRVLSAGELKNI